MELVFYYDDSPEDLEHFGVKGMKWGVRKKREYVPDSKRVSKLKQEYKKRSQNYKAKPTTLNKHFKNMAKNNLDYETSGKAAERRYKTGRNLAIFGAATTAYQAQYAIRLGLAAASAATIAPGAAAGLASSALVYAGYAAVNAAITAHNVRVARKEVKK